MATTTTLTLRDVADLDLHVSRLRFLCELAAAQAEPVPAGRAGDAVVRPDDVIKLRTELVVLRSWAERTFPAPRCPVGRPAVVDQAELTRRFVGRGAPFDEPQPPARPVDGMGIEITASELATEAEATRATIERAIPIPTR